MSLVIHLLHSAGRQMRVNLRGDKALVAKQLLHAAEVGAVIQQVRREAVPQRVRADSGIESRFDEIFVQLPADRSRVESDSPCLFRKTRCVASDLEPGDRSCEVSKYRCRALIACEPIGVNRSFRPLPRTRRTPSCRSRSLHLQFDQLAHADAAGVEHFEHRLVAGAEQVRCRPAHRAAFAPAPGPDISAGAFPAWGCGSSRAGSRSPGRGE